MITLDPDPIYKKMCSECGRKAHPFLIDIGEAKKNYCLNCTNQILRKHQGEK